MRRQTETGGASAGSSRALRLDPLALPVRYTAQDATADERTRVVELHRERVVVRRAVAGIRMAVNLAVKAFRGIAIRIQPSDGDAAATFAIMLEHRDPALSIPLHLSCSNDDVVAEWQLWSRVLGQPLLVTDLDGGLREPLPRLGQVRLGKPAVRRRRSSPLKRRRPSIVLRRRPGRPSKEPVIHRDEREIIARN